MEWSLRSSNCLWSQRGWRKNLFCSIVNTEVITYVSLQEDQKKYYAMQFISLSCYKYTKLQTREISKRLIRHAISEVIHSGVKIEFLHMSNQNFPILSIGDVILFTIGILHPINFSHSYFHTWAFMACYRDF
jgi:hypothetical protein